MRDMDENLMPVGSLWDTEVESQVNSRISSPIRKKGYKVDKDLYLQDIEGAYHAIGGFARLAHTANEDPKWFYSRFGDRLLPNVKEELDVSVTILPALPRNPLDGEYTDVTELDQGSDQAPRSLAQGAPCSPGREHSAVQDEEGGEFR